MSPTFPDRVQIAARQLLPKHAAAFTEIAILADDFNPYDRAQALRRGDAPTPEELAAIETTLQGLGPTSGDIAETLAHLSRASLLKILERAR